MDIQLILIGEERFVSGDSVNPVAARCVEASPLHYSLHGPQDRGYSINPLRIIHNNE